MGATTVGYAAAPVTTVGYAAAPAYTAAPATVGYAAPAATVGYAAPAATMAYAAAPTTGYAYGAGQYGGQNITADQLFSQIDTNGDGSISRSEMAQWRF